MARELKRLIVEEYRREFAGVEACVLVDISPLPVAEAAALRRHLREHRIRLRVVKNRLAARAFAELPLRAAAPLLRGPTAVAYCPEDPEGIATIKVLRAYLQRRGDLPVTVTGGVAGGTALGEPELEALAAIPDRPELPAILAGTVLGPARRLAAAVEAVAGGLARALQARIEKEEGGGESPSA